MDATGAISRNRLYGSVSVSEIPRNEWPDSENNNAVRRRFRYSWELPYQIVCQLPPEFGGISFEISVDKVGQRRFAPVGGTGPFVAWGGMVGQLMLEDRGEELEADGLSLNELRLASRYVRHLREYIGNTPKLAAALHIVRRGRLSDAFECRDILPDDIGLDASGNGDRWSLRRFTNEGRREAIANGIADPTPHDALTYGLLAASRVAPVACRPDEIFPLLRMALYSLGPSESQLGPEQRAYIAARLKDELAKHLDDTTAEFDRWAADPKSDLIRSMTRRKNCPVTRDQVRRGLVDIGIRWLAAQARCIDVAMHAFETVLPHGLQGYERELFAVVYRGDERLAGLPLVLLHERFDFCRPAIIPIWNEPSNQESFDVFYRYLSYFAEVLSKRRAADTRRKSELRSRPIEQVGDSHEVLKSVLQSAVEQAINRDLEGEQWDIADICESGDARSFRIICRKLGIDQELSFTLEQLGELGRDLNDRAL